MKSPEKEKVVYENVVTHNSGVQTDLASVLPPGPTQSAPTLQEKDPSLHFYRPPLERLAQENPVIQNVRLSYPGQSVIGQERAPISVTATRQNASQLPPTRTTVVDVTKSSIDPQIGRFVLGDYSIILRI